MGLDMYAHYRDTRPAKDVDFKVEDGDPEFHYWRKHPNLHGWMEALYRRKGGTDLDFNCVPVVLTSEDLDELQATISGETLPKTSAFFFGKSKTKDDLTFIAVARKLIAAGKTVYYTSWW